MFQSKATTVFANEDIRTDLIHEMLKHRPSGGTNFYEVIISGQVSYQGMLEAEKIVTAYNTKDMPCFIVFLRYDCLNSVADVSDGEADGDDAAAVVRRMVANEQKKG